MTSDVDFAEMLGSLGVFGGYSAPWSELGGNSLVTALKPHLRIRRIPSCYLSNDSLKNGKTN